MSDVEMDGPPAGASGGTLAWPSGHNRRRWFGVGFEEAICGHCSGRIRRDLSSPTTWVHLPGLEPRCSR